ncbi:hypothetical protein HID58_024703, partial [Brassica napus]
VTINPVTEAFHGGVSKPALDPPLDLGVSRVPIEPHLDRDSASRVSLVFNLVPRTSTQRRRQRVASPGRRREGLELAGWWKTRRRSRRCRRVLKSTLWVSMEFRDWDPGNQWRSGDYGWLRRFSSNEIEGSRQIGDTYQLDIGQILVRTIQRWMFMVIRFGLRNIRFRGSHFKESDDGIVWIVRWISFNSRSQESSGDQLVKRGPSVEEREEGELQCSEAKVGKDNKLVQIVQQEAPSLEFQEELAKTQAIGAAVISDPMDTENGLQAVNSLIGNVNEVEDGGDTDRIMDMDEIRAVFLEHGVDMDAADLEECSEGEMAEALRELEQASGEDNREVEQVTNVEAEKDMADGDVGKKNGSRKRLFKPTISTAASTKMRLAKALVSPRKRAVGKTGTRHGEPGKQMENKGPSIPKLGPPKP